MRIELESVFETGLRNIRLGLLASVALMLVPAVGEAADKGSAAGRQRAASAGLLNQIRADHDLAPLAASDQLRDAARAHSTDMLEHGYFGHDGPKETWAVRIAHYLKSPMTSENIAWGNGSYGTPQGIVSQWMRSPSHRAVILTAGLHRVGLGLAFGTYQGNRGAVMATADFAA